MVQISDLLFGKFEVQLLTEKEVFLLFKVKDLVLHQKVLTWMVVAPNSNCTIR
jgi:hypothetical protein